MSKLKKETLSLFHLHPTLKHLYKNVRERKGGGKGCPHNQLKDLPHFLR